MRFNYRAREGHDVEMAFITNPQEVSTTVPAEGTTTGDTPLAGGDSCFNYRARGGHDGITVLYGNTNIFFPILREVCDLRICMVLCL